MSIKHKKGLLSLICFTAVIVSGLTQFFTGGWTTFVFLWIWIPVLAFHAIFNVRYISKMKNPEWWLPLVSNGLLVTGFMFQIGVSGTNKTWFQINALLLWMGFDWVGHWGSPGAYALIPSFLGWLYPHNIYFLTPWTWILLEVYSLKSSAPRTPHWFTEARMRPSGGLVVAIIIGLVVLFVGFGGPYY